MYHVSPVEGLTVLEPREPQCARDIGEPIVPRVCAAPTIEDCLNALGELEYETSYYIYQIDAPPQVDNVGVMTWPPHEGGVWDAKFTGEVWYLEPTACVCMGPVYDGDGYKCDW